MVNYSIAELQQRFLDYLSGFDFKSDFPTLVDPASYILNLGGKRIRPVLLMAAYNLYKADIEKSLDAAMAIEMFHNFSLLHDDIMDNADMRRGKPSVHIKYDTNAAILTGDVMMIYSYKLLGNYPDAFAAMANTFTQTAQEVCEGQRSDMDFETSENVSIPDYIDMITAKTSVLLAAALKMGAILGDASQQDQEHLYQFGKNVGIAFQIQDDLLDTFGNESNVGKKIGGDIVQRKKTYLYLKSLDLLSEAEVLELKSLYNSSTEVKDDDELIANVKRLLKIAHVDIHAEELKLVYQQLAFSHLEAVSVSSDKKEPLKMLATQLLNRKS